MSGALNALRERLADQLRQNGLSAVAAMDCAPARRWREAAAAVSLSGVTCAPGGFKDYLGVWKDPETGRERETYGREAELTLTLDIFAPRDGGGDACQRAAETAVEALLCQGAAGLPILEIQVGRVEFLEKEGLYRQTVSCRCRAWLVARTDGEAGTFAEFEVRGRIT